MTYSINMEHFLAISNEEISLYMRMSVKFIVVDVKLFCLFIVFKIREWKFQIKLNVEYWNVFKIWILKSR